MPDFGRSLSEIFRALCIFLSLFVSCNNTPGWGFCLWVWEAQVRNLTNSCPLSVGRQSWVGVSPNPAEGSLPRGRGVPFRQCHLALAENDFSNHLCPVGSVSFSVHKILFFWSLAVPASARTRRGGCHGETRQCRPSPHGPHSVEKNSSCHLLTVTCVLFLSPLTTAFEADELCKSPLARWSLVRQVTCPESHRKSGAETTTVTQLCWLPGLSA